MTIENIPEYLFHQGTNYYSYNYLGSHLNLNEKTVTFRVWAPNSYYVYLCGDFNLWNKRSHPMKRISSSGIWEITVCYNSELKYNSYKYCIIGKNGEHLKADPYAQYSETLKKTASLLWQSNFIWSDGEWLEKRKNKYEISKYNVPINIYEMNLGSWHTKNDASTSEGKNYLNYREIADLLIPYIINMGYTHIEIMPVNEYPYDGSWGYQACGYFAPTSRFGTPDDFKYFINSLHNANIGIILDWVPAHFPKDEHGLYEFDGEPLYEYQGKDRMEHAEWGTRFFDIGRNEIQSFLISNAMYWIREFHVDGLRCDAVASMLYLDYDKKPGEWVPNIHGENINLESVAFFCKLNSVIYSEFPDVIIAAEESTAWEKVTKPISEGGLGFTFKWNMGWSNDILEYVKIDPLYRGKYHNKLTFSMMYAFSQKYILTVSHDEVVHGKKSLIDKMFGSYESKFAEIKLFFAYMIAHPGKKMIFMGCEFGQFREWDFSSSLEWFMLDYPAHKDLQNYVAHLNNIYKSISAFWEDDFSWEGFSWLEVDNKDGNIIIFERKSKNNIVVAICNFSGITHVKHTFDVSITGKYKILLNTNEKKYCECENIKNEYITARKNKISIDVLPFTAIYLYKEIK